MKGTFLGYSEGTSKAGKPFKIVYYSYSDGRTKGFACNKAFVDGGSGMDLAFPWNDISSGEAIELDYDGRGYLVGLDLLMPVK